MMVENGRFINPGEIMEKQSLPGELAKDVKDPRRRAIGLTWARTVFERVWRAAGVAEEDVQRLKRAFHKNHDVFNPGYDPKKSQNVAATVIQFARILENSSLLNGNGPTPSEDGLSPDGNGVQPEK